MYFSEKENDREKTTFELRVYTPVAAAASQARAKARSPKPCLDFPRGWQGSTHLDPQPLFFQLHQQGAELEMEQLGVQIWDMRVVSGN